MSTYDYTLPVKGSVNWDNTLIAPDGTIHPYGAGVSLNNTTINRKKTSVDTGSFKPGVYRINGYSVSEESILPADIDLLVEYFDGYWRYRAHMVGTLPLQIASLARSTTFFPPLSAPSYLPEQALVAAYGKIAGNDVGAGENLGELKETIETLRKPFSSLQDFLTGKNLRNLCRLIKMRKYLATGRWAGARTTADAAKAAAGTWLEWRYGIMPIVYTVKDIAEVVNKKVMAFDPNKIRAARSKQIYTKNLSNTGTAGFANIQLVATATGRDTFTCYASVQYRQAFEFGLASILGLTPRFIPEIAWELTRLSWVVDWWFGVGAWLGALRQKPGITILGNTVGTKVERQVSFRVRGKYPISSAKYSELGNLGAYQKRSYSRTVNQHLPLLPSVNLDYHSYFHTLDAVALILQKSLNLLKK